jgi:hypothetical protein
VNYQDFEIAFWHPFGPHGQETPAQIIERKRAEIEANGWTLWSFQHRSMLIDWHRELSSAKRSEVFAFCSDSRGAVDPARAGTPNAVVDCRSFGFVDETFWRPMPTGVRIPHPFRPGKKLASAFVVEAVIYPLEPFQLPAVEWFSPSKGPWCPGVLPTRGEYLIRRGGTTLMRKVCAVLKLKAPYLAVVSADGVELNTPRLGRFSRDLVSA